jgi:hypothetical protein
VLSETSVCYYNSRPRKIPQGRRFRIIISTNNSVYSTLFLYYESAHILLRFYKTVYINFGDKLPKQLFVCFWPESLPSGLWPAHSRGLQITHNDSPQPVGLLWTSNQLVAEIST